jgi:hypothetical protein
MKILGGAPIRFATASLLGAALAIAAPVAAAAAPATPRKASPTTTTTTKPGKNAQAFAKLVITDSSVGHVNVKTAGGSTFKPAKNGQSLHVGDTVQTDATGQAEIDYADTAYTRLDVNTTFTIKKLTDAQGNRQVEGSLDVGRTYNRTAALTQSQTFQQDAGGATAAVAGTAFVVACTSATSCNFAAVIDITNVSGPGGQIKTLNPLDECVANNGALCGTTTRLTPDELALIQWIQTNVLADLTEHGIGDGVFQPFAGTVVVTNGVVQSFTPSTPNQGFTPPVAPLAPPPPPNPPVAGKPDGNVCVGPVGSCTDTSTLTMDDDAFTGVQFTLNGMDPNNPPLPIHYQFTQLPDSTFTAFTYEFNAQNGTVALNTPYDPATNFTISPTDTTTPDTGSTSFKFKAVDNQTPTPQTSAPVNVDVQVTGPANDD